jgi:hypothetical protein
MPANVLKDLERMKEKMVPKAKEDLQHEVIPVPEA